MTKTGKKKFYEEERTFEVDVPDSYGTLDRFVESKNYIMMLSQMGEKVREDWFNAFMGCDKFEIIDHNCVGGRCFIGFNFYYEDLSDE